LNTKSLDKNSSAEWLKSGKILIHPTESIWGFGCDAFNPNAVKKIFDIKKRDIKKSFILLARSIDSIDNSLCSLSKEDKEYLSRYWPGPYTFLIKYKDNIPEHLKNDSYKLAVRVSNHLPIKILLERFRGLMVSTSANISGKKNMNNINKILNFFEYEDLAYYDEGLGTNKSPSQIIDLETKSIIRP
tara:strand:+ start:8685 stop:9245 length:561 start_codon:yes stop_codon:yes gene_type:complete